MTAISPRYFITPSAFEKLFAGSSYDIFARTIKDIEDGQISCPNAYMHSLDNNSWLYIQRCRIPAAKGEEAFLIADEFLLMSPILDKTIDSAIPLNVV